MGIFFFNVGKDASSETEQTDVYTKAVTLVAFWPKHDKFDILVSTKLQWHHRSGPILLVRRDKNLNYRLKYDKS